MALYDDPSLFAMRDRFNLRRDGSRSNIVGAAPAIGKSFLDSDQGAGAAYGLFKGLADPGKQKGLSNAFNDVYTNYKAAVATNNQLTFTDFLDQVSPDQVYKSLDWFNRGERPSAYQGRYKFIGGG